jgi:hypothetical protein
MNLRLLSLAVVVSLLIAPASPAGEGFGMLKKAAKLTRVHPPQIFLPGAKIAVRASGQGSKYSAAAQRLQSLLESELLGNDTRLKLEPTKPETIVEVTVLQSDYSDDWQTRKGTQRVKTGSVDSKGKAIYADREVTFRVQIINYTFAAAFKVHDAKGNRSLGADTINRPFHKEFVEGNGAPASSALESDAIRAVVTDMTHRLAPTREVIGVLLPKGTFETAIAYADAGLWTKYLDALEKIPPLAKPTDEAYRQYALGVAFEALGYGAPDVDSTLKYLGQASVHYNNAVDVHPKEAYFTKPYDSFVLSTKAEAPLGRVQAALVQYQRLKEFAESSAREPAVTVAGSKATAGGGRVAEDGGLNNASVIEMLQAGLPEEVILTAINSAQRTSFDVSPKGLIHLAEAKASKKLLQRIQAVAQKTPAAQAKPAPGKTKRSGSK